MSEAAFCDRCGQPLMPPDDDAGHAGCAVAPELEPPRYCPACGRRMVVKVTPDGWSSRCSRHGLTVSRAGLGPAGD